MRSSKTFFTCLALAACSGQRELAPNASGRATAPLRAQLEPDGNDEDAPGAITVPAQGRFAKVGRHWAALGRVCDFAVLDGALFMAHATTPLQLDGATITRYQPSAPRPFSLAFDWTRPGEPTRGGGGGQGFLRARLIDGRLWVPDADPPYLGLGLASGVEGYLFVSDTHGAFRRARLPGHLPPAAPNEERGGAIVLPGVLHGFDVIRFRGRLYASSGAVIPPNGSATSSPGVLFTPADGPGPWQVAFSYAGVPGDAAVRLGLMTRFRDRLYVAVSPLSGNDPTEFLLLEPPRDATTLAGVEARRVQVTAAGGAHTLRWYTDRGKLYWITIGGGGGELRVSTDGDHFELLELPTEAGSPSDVLRAGDQLLVLAEHGLYELANRAFELRAALPDKAFAVDNGYCAPPLVVYDGNVYLGDQLRGELWKLVAE